MEKTTLIPGTLMKKEVLRFVEGNAFTGSPNKEYREIVFGRISPSGKWILIGKRDRYKYHNRQRVPITDTGWEVATKI